MRVLMVAAELLPLAKAGGLGDMVAALSGALGRLGHDVRCALPMYRGVRGRLPEGAREVSRRVVVLDAGRGERAALVLVEGPGLPAPVLLVDHPLFDREGIYDDPATRRGWPDNGRRWAVFCRAVHAGLGADGWAPDVVHAHDHQAAPLLGLLRWGLPAPHLARRPGTVFTIHNLGYQGVEDPAWMADSGLPWTLLYPLSPVEFHGQVNLMKMGIEAADRLTTVSPRYAEEIRTSAEFGAGLQDVLAAHAGKLSGILNGVDVEVWDPAIDPHLRVRYTPASLSEKSRNRAALRREMGLPPGRSGLPLVGMIGRLTSQKGLDLLLPALPPLLEEGVQVVVLGSGEARYEAALAQAAADGPGLAVRLGYDEGLAHRIEAGADVFLMPSRYEPCGLNQMYSLRYGTVPVVRAVGGLADTVVDLDEDPPRSNGFVFRLWEPVELLKTVRRAVRAFGDRSLWRGLQERGMAADVSWDRSARRYAEVYAGAMG